MKDAAWQLQVICAVAGADLPGILSCLSLMVAGIKSWNSGTKMGD